MQVELILIDRYTQLLNLDNLTYYHSSKADWIRSIEIKIAELENLLYPKHRVDKEQQGNSKHSIIFVNKNSQNRLNGR